MDRRVKKYKQPILLHNSKKPQQKERNKKERKDDLEGIGMGGRGSSQQKGLT